jgi:hypothetical protein
MIVEVEIKNWEKYNPKRDQTTYTWLRLDNEFYCSPDLFDLTCEQKMVWIAILCIASRKNSGKVQANVNYIAHHLRIVSESVLEALEIFEQRGLTTAHDRTLSQPSTATTPTNVTNERNERTLPRTRGRPPPVPVDPVPKTNEFIAAYCQKFKDRWGSNPEIKGKNAGIAKRLAKGWSLERTEILLDAFFSMPDAQLVKAKHPLTMLEYKLNEITVFADSGTFTTQLQAFQADRGASNQMLLQKIREGKL